MYKLGKASLRTWIQQFEQRLQPIWNDPLEVQALVYQVFRHYTGCTLEGLLLDDVCPNRLQWMHITQALERLEQGEPLQYILGEASFCGYLLSVSPSVLIPRPETEEMVAFILSREPTMSGHVIDLGTGSGCIAITLANSWPDATVVGLDISQQALDIAAHNGRLYNPQNPRWVKGDVLRQELPNMSWDIIVSNPPYIPQDEQIHMQRHVTDHEPHIALFVPSETPLCFYEAIAAYAVSNLVMGGRIYVEVHENHAFATRDLFIAHGLSGVTLHKDLNGKWRWISGTKIAGTGNQNRYPEHNFEGLEPHFGCTGSVVR